jgi:hypothetical protein
MDLFTCCDNRTKLCYVDQTAYAARTYAHYLIHYLYWNSADLIFKQSVNLIILKLMFNWSFFTFQIIWHNIMILI